MDMAGRSTASTMVGQDVAMPVALAPVGLTGMQHADGEIKAARAAEKFGVPFTLSTLSICSIEDVAENTEKPFWFQVYTLRDEDFMKRLFERAKDAEMFGPRHHRRPAGARPAAQGPQERAFRAAQADREIRGRHDDQGPLGAGHAGHEAARVPQRGGPCRRA